MERIVILVSHPIPYQAPLFRLLAADSSVQLSVLFCWQAPGTGQYFDKEIGENIDWGADVLGGYSYRFLRNWSWRPSSEFWGQMNFGIISEIRKNKLDAVVIFGWNSFTNWLAFFTAFITNTKVFLRGESPLNQELLKAPWKLVIKKLIFKPLFRHMSAFLYIGEENRKFYKYYGVPDEKLFFVPYAVDNERFMKMAKELKPKRSELRKKLLNIADDRPIILFLGKLIEKKRPMDLLKAFEILHTKYNILNTDLVFVGDGALRPNLEMYVKERDLKGVHFAGFKNQTEIPEYYAMADVFVLPSGPGETWGLVVNEAMCFGLPVIVSDMVGCGPDLVRNGKNGFIFPLGDVGKLAGFLYQAISSGQNNKSFEIISPVIVGKYSYTTNINELRRVLNNHPGFYKFQ